MKYKLIMLSEPILVSDEKQKEGDYIIHKTLLDKIWKAPDKYGSTQEHWYKVIAGIPELPSIDFSALSEEDCKKIEWVDVDKIFKQETTSVSWSERGYYDAFKWFKEGFKTAQSLNEKRYSEEDMKKAINLAYVSGGSGNTFQECSKFIEDQLSLSQPKVFEVEVEMEPYSPYDPRSKTGRHESEDDIAPKIINNSIRITRVL